MRLVENKDGAALMAGQTKVSRRARENSVKPSVARGSFSLDEQLDERLLGRARILVVGDVMLDRYWFGEVDRVSPEAPVPIVKIDRTEPGSTGRRKQSRHRVIITYEGKQAGREGTITLLCHVRWRWTPARRQVASLLA